MFKKYSIIVLCLLSLVIVGCGKSGTSNTSNNLQNCQSLCDQQAVMYKDQAANYKSSCYSNCQKIETMNQERNANGDLNNYNISDSDVSDSDEETTTTDDEIITEADCDKMCNSNIRLSATTEERKECEKSCKMGIKIGSDNINDCNNIEIESEGMFTKDSCIATKAVDQNKIEYCEMIEDEQTIATCYIGLAQANNDISICNKIKNEENKAYCNMILSQ